MMTYFQTRKSFAHETRPQRRRILAMLALLLTAVLLLPGRARAQEVAPALELKDQAGKVHSLADYSGKVIIVNFWATWCGPCAKEMPLFVDLAKQYGEKGVVVLAVSLDAPETQSQIAPFIEKQKIEFPVLVGATLDQMKLFKMGQVLPGTIFIDQQGKVFGRILGQVRKKEVVERVEYLLGLSQSKKPPKALVKHY